eukprot:3068694-Alexandrium_andersonii.AAC.1
MGEEEISAEVLRAFPIGIIHDLADMFIARLDGVSFSHWGKVIVKLRPKGSQARVPKDFGPIALLN